MAYEAVFERRDHTAFTYPKWLGTWPAVVFFILFAWMELISDVVDGFAAFGGGLFEVKIGFGEGFNLICVDFCIKEVPFVYLVVGEMIFLLD